MNEASKRTFLRLNVSCKSRDKKFLVLGDKDATVSNFVSSVKKMFTKLYPYDAPLGVSNVKNSNGFDVFFEYKLGDLFEDNECLDIIELDIGCKMKEGDESTSSGFQEEQNKRDNLEDGLVHDTSLTEQGGQGDAEGKSKSKKDEVNEENPKTECTSPTEHKRPHSDWEDDQEKRKKRNRNRKKKPSSAKSSK